MTRPDTANPLAMHVILSAAADVLEDRSYGHFSGGPEIYIAIHVAVTELFSEAVSEELRRHLGATQLQFWNGTQEEAVAELRAAAGDAPLDLAAYQDAAATRRLENIRALMCVALDLPSGNDCSLEQLADDTAGRLRRAEEAVADLAAEIARLTQPGTAPRLSWELAAGCGPAVEDLTTASGEPVFTDRQTVMYLRRCRNADLSALQPWRTLACPECGAVPAGPLFTGSGLVNGHVMLRGAVILGCGGYMVVNPAALRMDRESWHDWHGQTETEI